MGADQSTLSRQLQSLEIRLGRPLFSRHRLGLEPTSYVKNLLETAEKIEFLILGLRNFDPTHHQEPQGEVHISCPSSIADRMIASHLHDFINKNPLVRIRLSTANREFDLNRFECDIAILLDKPSKADSVNLRLTSSSLKFFGHKMFSSTYAKTQITSLPFVCLPDQVKLLKKIVSDINVDQFRLVSDRLASNIIAAERGAGVILLPEVFGLYLKSLNPIEVEGWPNIPVDIYMASPKAVRNLSHVNAAWLWIKHLFRNG
jgi:DNA-binding transcriptional LysR family regulator